MKNSSLAFAVAGLVWVLAGCANQSSTASNGNTDDPSRRTYSQSQLNNTGRHDAAGQLQAADPSVSVSNGR